MLSIPKVPYLQYDEHGRQYTDSFGQMVREVELDGVDPSGNPKGLRAQSIRARRFCENDRGSDQLYSYSSVGRLLYHRQGHQTRFGYL